MEDIFSKSKNEIKPEEPLKIIVDFREKNSLLISELISYNIKVEFRQLPVADYIIGDLAIERKTVSDFISSMINKRLFKQLEEIQQYPSKLLMIEGIDEQELYNENLEGVSSNAIRGFILSILLKYHVPILFTKNYEDSAKFILVLLKKKDKEHSIHAKKRAQSPSEQLQFILEGFPGIGPSTARKLLEKYHTLKEIINTPLDQLKQDIGKKAEVFRLFTENYNSSQE